MDRTQRLGDLLVESGDLTLEQLEEALAAHDERPNIPLGQVLVDLGFVTPERMQLLLSRHGKRLRIGETLVRQKALSKLDLEQALADQKKGDGRLGEILLEKGLISERDLFEGLAVQFNLPLVSIAKGHPTEELRGLVNPVFAAQNRMVPVSRVGKELTVALSDPTRQHALHDLESTTGLIVTAVLAIPSEVANWHRRLYGREASDGRDAAARKRVHPHAPAPSRRGDPAGNRWSLERTEADPERGVDGSEREFTYPSSNDSSLEEPAPIAWNDTAGVEVLEDDANEMPASKYVYGTEDSPVVQNVVQAIIRRALALRASDIHLEANVSGPRLRLRVDGVLQEHHLGPFHDLFRGTYRSIISRLKIVSQLDITERRRPQDGSFRMMVRSSGQLNAVDFRLSTLPGRFGEGMVIRILDQLRAPATLESLGLSPRMLEQFHALIHRPVGILLISGPTGSGKSSTLYAALRTIYHAGIKILTAEDPIEYTHPGICQAEVNTAIGNSFAKYLRTFLRQDPDVIMVGEIRDAETAEMALRAAQTGHLLFSTLHTNNSTASIQRLLDLEMDPNSVASALIGVMAQRLVRKICLDCREPYEPEAYMVEEWFEEWPRGVVFQHGRGCAACNGSGYSGRACVAEVWTPTQHEILLINKRASSEELRQESLLHMESMGEDALRKVLAGMTTIEEVFRIVPYADVRHVKAHRSRTIVAELLGSDGQRAA